MDKLVNIPKYITDVIQKYKISKKLLSQHIYPNFSEKSAINLLNRRLYKKMAMPHEVEAMKEFLNSITSDIKNDYI